MEDTVDVKIRKKLSFKIRHEIGKAVIMTTDSLYECSKPYETMLLHPSFNLGLAIVVGVYDTKEEAEEGHAYWLEVFSGKDEKTLPLVLIDVSDNTLSNLMDNIRSDIEKALPGVDPKDYPDLYKDIYKNAEHWRRHEKNN